MQLDVGPGNVYANGVRRVRMEIARTRALGGRRTREALGIRDVLARMAGEGLQIPWALELSRQPG